MILPYYESTVSLFITNVFIMLKDNISSVCILVWHFILFIIEHGMISSMAIPKIYLSYSLQIFIVFN